MQWRGPPIAGSPSATRDNDTVRGSQAKARLWKDSIRASGTSLEWGATR